jgi:glutathione-specific gamma-glutamylcyclotransferase
VNDSRRQSPHLTRELIDARFPQPVLHASQSMGELSDEEIEASLRETLAQRRGEDLWLFGYGSLMWRPDFAFEDRELARVQGYHRSFCLWQKRSRGNRLNPNLMLALDAGGSCWGVAFRVPAPNVEAKVSVTWRRELVGNGYRPRWVAVRSQRGPLTALAFVANRANSERYTGRLPEPVIARYIAEACGEKGSGAEYLLETVLALEAMGVRDTRLWRIQKLVADHLDR